MLFISIATVVANSQVFLSLLGLTPGGVLKLDGVWVATRWGMCRSKILWKLKYLWALEHFCLHSHFLIINSEVLISSLRLTPGGVVQPDGVCVALKKSLG